MLGRLRTWLDERGGLAEPLKAFPRRLPRGVGWWHALGGATLAVLVVELLTGMILAMYYSPHPDAAYESVRYIDRELPMGRIVRGIHVYGMSVLVVLAGIHLLRAFFHAAYKRPRELTWVLGILVLVLLLGFGFTGDLLPWDQKGYFSTRVRTGFPEGIPLVGPALKQLLLGGRDIGALTLTRFYALHALVLPALLLLPLGAHVFLAWRHGPSPPGAKVGETVPASRTSGHHQRFRTAVLAMAAIAFLTFVAWQLPVETEFKADPTGDPGYHPRPEWYFLALFQFLNEWSSIPGLGRLPNWLPAVVLPGIVVTFLALAPWIDRSPERAARRRKAILGAVAVGLTGVALLTVRAYGTLAQNATPSNSLYGHLTEGGEKELAVADVRAGRATFAQCGGCHAAYQDYAGKAGPDLSGYGRKTFLTEVPGHPSLRTVSFYERFVGYIRGTIRPKDAAGNSTSKMPNYPVDALSQEQLNQLGVYLSQDPVRAEIRRANPRQPGR